MGYSRLASIGVLLLALRTVFAEECEVAGYLTPTDHVIDQFALATNAQVCKVACRNTEGCLSFQWGGAGVCSLLDVDLAHYPINRDPTSDYFFWDLTCPVCIFPGHSEFLIMLFESLDLFWCK